MQGDHRVDPGGRSLTAATVRRVGTGRWLAGGAGLVAAVLAVLALNYLVIPPRRQFGVAHWQDGVALVVLLCAVLAVDRLAVLARRRAREAERRARLAAAREREAALLAGVASTILAGATVEAQLGRIGTLIAQALGVTRARVVIAAVPEPAAGELTQPLATRSRATWLHVAVAAGAERSHLTAEVQRLSEPLGRLLDVAIERERIAEQAAETEAARRADRAKTAVLHAISHDLRSPLTAVITAASALRGDVTAVEHAELLDVIDVEARRLAKLVSDLLDLSRIEAGAVAPQTDWCDLREVVSAAVAGLRSPHPLAIKFPPELPLVRADPAQLERAFSNLIENAIKFSPSETPVSLVLGAVGGRVTARVTDRGTGITGVDRPHIFEPFFRGRRTQGTGSGLGLAICRGFVEANGGRVVLAPARNDAGASFAVSFPAVASPELAGART